MHVLVDTDVVIKAFQYAFVDQFEAVLKRHGWHRPFISPREANNSQLFAKMEEITGVDCSRLKRDVQLYIDNCTPVPAIADAALRRELNRPQIDPGERQLFAYALTHVGSVVITGDKSALSALARERSLADHRSSLKGRIVHFEQLVLELSATYGVSYVRTAIRLAPYADLALSSDFDQPQRTDYECESLLRRRVEALERVSGGLLFKFS